MSLLKKVEYPYCSLGLLQQIIMISGADHRDLSVVWQAQAQQIELATSRFELPRVKLQ